MKIYMQTELLDNAVIGDSTVSKMSYFDYMSEPRGIPNLLKNGSRGRSLFTKLRNPEYLHTLYLNKDKEYFKFLEEFKRRYLDYDVIVMNPGVDLVHPEFLWREFPNALKVLYMIDDPHTTYSYSLPFAWAFDAAVYVVKGYSPDITLDLILKNAGVKNVKWTPHCVSNLNNPEWTIPELKEQLKTRENKAIYVGSYYGGKQNRLSYLKAKLENNFDIFGRYPLGGWSFPLLSGLDGFLSKYRVAPLTHALREEMYRKYAVGINMHLTWPVREVGNARLYELAYRGVAQVVEDSPEIGSIFLPDREILTYRNLDECVYQVNRLFRDPDLRISLATNAYERACDEYRYQNVLENLVGWFKATISSNSLKK